MKIAISGKGGVGKTTLAAILAMLYAQEGKKVLAVDADPVPNLAVALGIPPSVREAIVPLAEMKALIAERTGAGSSGYGAFFRLNPKVDDLPDRFSCMHGGVRLLVMGGVKGAGEGCFCPENALLKQLFRHLLLEPEQDVLIADMEAGIEHLTRGTAGAMNALIVVVEPSLTSCEVARRMRRLAEDLGIPRIYAVGNKVGDRKAGDLLQEQLADWTVLGMLPESRALAEASLLGRPAAEADPQFTEQVMVIKVALNQLTVSTLDNGS